ncbi:MAG: HAD family hydrolase [Erysipelotrichaceae bacterium]|nr:HAD family hydrolase [Erysipelotrichaceae bacterium]
MSKIRHIFFDIDNTLTDNVNNVLPSSVKPALDRLAEEGYLLSIATGRDLKAISDEVMDLVDWFSVITFNGQIIYDRDLKCIHRRPMDRDSVRQAMKVADETGMTLELKTEFHNFRYNDANESYLRTYEFFNMDPWPKDTLKENEEVIAMIASSDTDDYEGLRKIEGLEVFVTEHHYADVNLRGMSKYEGVKFLQGYYGFSEYIAFGDSMNDYEMLENATVSVAMGDAEDKVKEICTYVTEPAGKDGLAKMVPVIESL